MNRNSLPTESEKDENIDFENMMKDDDGADSLENGDPKKSRSLRNISVEENEEHANEAKSGSKTPKRAAASYQPGAKSDYKIRTCKVSQTI